MLTITNINLQNSSIFTSKNNVNCKHIVLGLIFLEIYLKTIFSVIHFILISCDLTAKSKNRFFFEKYNKFVYSS